MDSMQNILYILDPFFIWAFRLAEDPWTGFFLGMAFLNMVSVVLGDATSLLARRLNRKVYGQYHDDMLRHHNLSVQAIKTRDKAAYKAVNKQAHEAFGKYFFSQAGAFVLSIWPVPFTLAWMDLRFQNLPLPLPVHIPWVGESVYFPFFLLPMYILERNLYGKSMRRFAWYLRLEAWAKHGTDMEILRFEDLVVKPEPDTFTVSDQGRLKEESGACTTKDP